MPPVGFEPATSVAERPQTYALDRAATGIGYKHQLGRDIHENKGRYLHNYALFSSDFNQNWNMSPNLRQSQNFTKPLPADVALFDADGKMDGKKRRRG